VEVLHRDVSLRSILVEHLTHAHVPVAKMKYVVLVNTYKSHVLRSAEPGPAGENREAED